jgi:hypothetical protein
MEYDEYVDAGNGTPEGTNGTATHELGRILVPNVLYSMNHKNKGMKMDLQPMFHDSRK